MKIFHRILFTAIVFSFAATLPAQQTSKPVRFLNGNFITGNAISRGTFKKEDISGALAYGKYYVLVQFSSLPSAAAKQQLKQAGIELGTYLPENAYLATVNSDLDFSKATSLNINSINILPAFYKIHSKLKTYQPAFVKKEDVQAIAVKCFEQADKTMVLAAIKNTGAIIVTQKFQAANIIIVQFNPFIIDSIAALPFVSSLSLQPVNDKPLNYNIRASHSVSGLNAVNGKNLNGRGVTVGIGDDANVSAHIDFAGRLTDRSGPIVQTSHGIHTTGTVAGAGNVNIRNRGIASKANIVSQFFDEIIANAPTYIADYNLVLTNNSYHSAPDDCSGNGEYNELSVFGDDQMYNNGQLQHVFASGNDGDSTCSSYPASFGTVKSGWQMAKNILTVGAVRVDINATIAGFSSRGPAADGRIKPEITADGVGVTSTTRNNAYGLNSGTSMACPAVTGGLTLLYERYRQTHAGANPKSALMKALICNTAEDLGNPGPDFTYGFGMMNVRRAVEAVDSNRYFVSSIANAGSNTHNFTIPPNTRRVKIMLYWNDVPAASNAATSLVNDLDLVVIEPSFTLHRPLTLNSTPANVNNTATEFPDHLNNIEQVVIDNPAAGIYSANINGFSIPSGVQDYVVTYEIIKNGVTVEYPFGGETLVPGETENIRWTAYGNESNNFTIDYSADNGSNWTTINNSVAAASRILSWTVPATATNTALIRVSRNGSSFTDQSDFNFTVLGQPTLSSTNVCEGSVQLNWAAVTNATSYDIFQLTADSMKVIGNTAANNFLITGLNKNSNYWFAVAAKNNAVAGRRSISIQVFPNSGPCTLSNFNNDIKVDSILEPNTARAFFSNIANASKPVKVSIKNLGTIAVTGPYDVSFDYGGAIVTETENTTIPAGASIQHVFTGMYPLPPGPGYRYNFKAWVTKAADNNHLNDTAYKTVAYINNNPIATLPLTEGFEAMPVTEARPGEMAVGNNNHLDFFASTNRGRLRTFINSDFAFDGNQALTLDQLPYNGIQTTDSAILSYNLSLFSAKQVRLDFYYKNQGQSDAAGNRVWIRGSENDPWILAYNLFSNQADIGNWKKALININDVLNNAVPPQSITATFQIKLGETGYTSANNATALGDIDDGYTFDNLVLSDAVNDIAALGINSPDKAGCGLVANTPVSIKIKNYHNTVLNNVQVSYQVNGGAVVTETIPSIAANQTLDYTFTQTANMAAYIDYNVDVWAKFSGDSYAANDSVLNYKVHNSPVISSSPSVVQGFENDNGNFYATGIKSTWQWGTPSKSIINKAANGSKIWTNNLNGNYTDNESSYLVTPCYDLTNIIFPMLSFSYIYDLEPGYDYAWVEYSTDGKTWNRLGNFNEGTNWYNDSLTNSWNGQDGKWHVASMDIPVVNTTVRFRFVMSSDGGVTHEGLGIDDVRVFSRTDIAGSPLPLFPGDAFSPGQDGWAPVWYGDGVMSPFYVVGEINTHGQNLGTVTMQPYVNFNAARTSGNQYYLDKSIVVSSTVAPTGPVGLRLYFSDAQVESILNANNCGTCIKPADAYDIGVTNYSGNTSDEDGTLINNLDGYYTFIPPANTLIVPHNGGYYAEFTSNKLGEFWFSKGDINPGYSDICQGSSLSFGVPGGASTYQWQVNTGSGYTNISNGINYSGATTDTLQLINLPTSFTGNRYRCIVNAVPGIEYTVRFKTLWTGTSSTNWFTAANWSCGTIPDQYTDVVIPAGKARYPVLTASTAIRSLRVIGNSPVTINTGAVLELKGK